MINKIGMLDCISSHNSESFIVNTSNNNYMIDTGYNNAFESIKKLYSKVDRQKNSLDYLVISHGDDDHCKGINKIIDEFYPRFIVFSPIHIYKYILLQRMGWNTFYEEGNRVNLVRQILSSQKYKKFYRIISKEKIKKNTSENLEFHSDRFNLDIIELEDGVATRYFDIILAVSDNYSKNNNNRNIKDDIRILIQKDLDEFQTYDTGQTYKIEQSLTNLIKHINIGNVSIDNCDENDLNKFLNSILKYEVFQYNKIPKSINKEVFIKIFKSKVIKKINNAMSLIVTINDALFTGDSEKQQISNVVNILSKKNKDINIIKVSHHGSIKNHLPKLYEIFKPKVCLLKLSSKTQNTKVVRYLLDNTNTKICNSLYYRKCYNGIVLEIINNSILSNKKCEFISNKDYSKKVIAKLTNLNLIITHII